MKKIVLVSLLLLGCSIDLKAMGREAAESRQAFRELLLLYQQLLLSQALNYGQYKTAIKNFDTPRLVATADKESFATNMMIEAMLNDRDWLINALVKQYPDLLPKTLDKAYQVSSIQLYTDSPRILLSEKEINKIERKALEILQKAVCAQ